MSWRKRIEQFSRQRTGQKPASGFDHFQRTYKTARRLLKLAGLKYDEQVLHAACYLHDISADYPHQLKSADQACAFLVKMSFPPNKIDNVRHAILEHVIEGRPKSHEAVALHDADLIDFLGATGVTRLSYATTGWFHKTALRDTLRILKQYRKKAFENLVLDESKGMARDKAKFMDMSIKAMEKELR